MKRRCFDEPFIEAAAAVVSAHLVLWLGYLTYLVVWYIRYSSKIFELLGDPSNIL